MAKLPEEVLLGMIANAGGGGGGTSDYSQLTNKPEINGVTLSGDKSASDLSLASLDANGKVPAAQLPSYVDDVINGYLYEGHFYEDAEHQTEITGESGKIYVDLETNKTYRWSGLAFAEISESLALGETASTAYAGDKGKANADAITAIKDGQTIDSFGDVETALSGKQGALTAGDYIDITSGEISVNREIPNETVSYEFKTKGTSEPNIAIIVTKRSNGTVVWEREYQYLDVLTPIVIDDVIKFGYQWVNAGQWTYEMLVASDSHAVGYRQSWGYLETKDYTEDFSLIDNTGLKLVIKSEMDNALEGKQDSLTAGDYIGISSGTVKVNLEKGQPDVYAYKFVTTSTSDYTPSVKVQKYLNGTLVSETNYENSEVRTPVEFDGRIRFWYGEGGGFVWSYRNLVASNEHVNPTTTTWAYNQTVEYEETFDVYDQSTKLATQGYVDTALSGKQDTLTFDSVPTDGSTNPVESNGVYDALAVKQNATDNSLDTDAKTIVGAINEHEGDIGSLKSGLTNLDNEVNGDATTYPYADVITIEDAIPANVADCNVKIEPVQDLHGQSAPYVGGAGKNKLPLTVDIAKSLNGGGTWTGNTYNFRDVDFTVNTDSNGNVTSVKVNGTASQNVTLLLDFVGTASTEYYIGGCPTNGGNNTFYLDTFGDGVARAADYGGGATFTADGNSQYVRIGVQQGYNAQNLMFYPMICLSSETDKSYAPYTNICPITGHTEASVQRDGKNFCPYGSMKILDGEYFTLPAGTYTFSLKVLGSNNYSTSHIGLYDDPNEPALCKVRGSAGAVVNTQVTLAKSTQLYVRVVNMVADSNGYYCDNIQLELGQTATPYEPYQGKTYTIALGDTIYGGTVRIDSNGNTVMDVGSVCVEYDGVGESWFNKTKLDNVVRGQLLLTDAFNSNSNAISNYLPWVNNWSADEPHFYIYDNKINVFLPVASTADFETYLTSNILQVCYELATPTTVQLTPQQIQLLKGQNTLTASTGQISVTVNGVSGSIGALTEDVAELQSGLDNITPTLVYTSPTTGTYGDKLDGVKTAFNNLSSAKKKTSYIVLGGSTKYGVTNWNDGIFSASYYDAVNSVFKFLSINLSGTGDAMMVMLSATTNGNSIESRVSAENSNTFALYA